MALADLEIDLVVRRRHFQNAGAEFRIDRFVSDDWNLLARQRSPGVFANKIGVPLVVWMNCHRGIGHDCFRPCSRDFQKTPGSSTIS